ncbi:DUF192 domain-containing protein [Haloplanus aerogenes]|nr:DUF192 domain-containing protein [Haloplanus aerogenes]
MGTTAPTTTPTATDSGSAETATTTATATVSTPGSNYDTATVVVSDENGTQLVTVDAWVADSFSKQYTGLSDTSTLDDGQGMLFVFDGEDDRAFVMRDMAFPLDMIFIDAEGTITTIHHAPLESDGDLTRYRGQAKYVLEVPMGYTNRTGIDVGDQVRIEE